MVAPPTPWSARSTKDLLKNTAGCARTGEPGRESLAEAGEARGVKASPRAAPVPARGRHELAAVLMPRLRCDAAAGRPFAGPSVRSVACAHQRAEQQIVSEPTCALPTNTSLLGRTTSGLGLEAYAMVSRRICQACPLHTVMQNIALICIRSLRRQSGGALPT